jgi:P4 family phage/plasmid primase-like protien
MIQEKFGEALWEDYPSKKATMLVGDGDNGKSTLIHVLKNLLGLSNISARHLFELEINRFAKADLYGKLANLYADLPDSALKTVGIFKMLTGGDPITAEHKFKNAFTFINFAKLWFSCNKVPEVYEDTSAYFSRWDMITFPNTFSGSKANRDLKKELTTDLELSGVLNFALDGLSRLRENGWTFSNSRSTEELRDEYIRKSSPIHAFVIDCTTVKPGARTVKKQLFQAFVDYCTLHHLPIVSQNTFFQRLPEFAKFETQHPILEGKRVWCVVGIELKNREQWGEKLLQTGLNGESSESLDRQNTVHDVLSVPKEQKDVHQGHDVHASSHLSSHPERLDLLQQEDREEALSRVKRLGPQYFRELGEIIEYLSSFCDAESANRFVTEQSKQDMIRHNPDGFLEVA